MPSQEHFAEICRAVCGQRGWQLTPAGIEVRFPNGRQQVVELSFFEFQQQDLLRLSTSIGEVEQLSPVRLTVALRINAELAHGALAIIDDVLAMTDTLMLSDADFDEIEASVSYLAETADYYERTLFGTDQY